MSTFQDKEIKLLTKYAKRACNVLEFGVGESTELFNSCRSVVNIFSVESDRTWLQKMVLKDLRKVNYRYIEFGARPNTWGTPSEEFKNAWSYYSDQSLKVSDVDTVFVDGRFRVACMLKAFLSCSSDCVFMMHDYTNRPHYFEVEKFFDKVEQAGTLVVFKKKSEYDEDLLLKSIAQYEMDYR